MDQPTQRERTKTLGLIARLGRYSRQHSISAMITSICLLLSRVYRIMDTSVCTITSLIVLRNCGLGLAKADHLSDQASVVTSRNGSRFRCT